MGDQLRAGVTPAREAMDAAGKRQGILRRDPVGRTYDLPPQRSGPNERCGCGPLQDGVAFLGTLDRAKVRNLKRDPRCSLLVSREDWWGYMVLEGRARIVSSENTAPEEWRLALRDTQRAYSGREHPNWQQFDETMVRERRVSVIIVPEHIYGTAI